MDIWKKTAIITALALSLAWVTGTWAFSRTSDHLSLSWPGAGVDHRLQFRIAEAVPAGGSLVVRFDPFFEIPADFDYLDVDLATGITAGGPYADRELATSADAIADGVTVASGYGGTITIGLNTTAGLATGDYMLLRLGTEAVYGGNGDSRIINPVATGTARVDLEAYSETGERIDHSQAAVFIIEPVRMGLVQPKIRSNGSPSGFLSKGTVSTILSLNTNYAATCRWSTVGTTSYGLMVDQFTTTGAYFHSALITGISSGVYTYYIRCLDTDLVADQDDYIIEFTIKAQGESEDDGTGEGDEGGPGTGGSGGPGTGGGTGGGTGTAVGPGTGDLQPFPPPPADPSVVLEGWAYIGSPVTLLRDGVEAARLTAGSDAKFSLPVAELKEGVYTFSILTNDKDNRRPPAYSTTFWVKAGTKTVVGNIVLAPTIAAADSAVEIGEVVSVLGASAPNATVEVWLQPDVQAPTSAETIKQTVTAGPLGDWVAVFDTAGFKAGIYRLKARSILPAGTSEWGQILKVGIGAEAPVENLCAGSDLNQDGKVNITDFSILLYWWGTDNDCADQNDDGTVNLIDFSIMMYNWTG